MGSGYRVFTAGEVLSASNVQNYLQDQAVMVFGGTAARSSAIGTANFEEGMLTYLTDVDKLQVYTGAAFVDVYPAAATNQGLTLINTTSFSGVSSQSINDVFSATYDNYLLQMNFTSSGNVDVRFRFRVGGADNSTTNYHTHVQFCSSAANTYSAAGYASQGQFVITSSNGTDSIKAVNLNVFNPFLTQYSLIAGNHTHSAASGAGNYNGGAIEGGFAATTSFTGFSIFPSSGTITGSISVYGVNK